MLGNVERSPMMMVYQSVHDGWMRFKKPQMVLDAKVQQQAQSAFQTLGLSFALTWKAGVYFGTVPCSVYLCQGLVIAGTLLVAFEVARYAIGRFMTSSRQHALNATCLDWIHRAAWLNVINSIGCAGVNTLLHEGGHALAGLTCLKNANPSIVLHPFRGGATHFSNMRELTQFGVLLGPQYAMLFITLAGLAASVLVSTIDFAIAHAWKKSCPQLATALNLHGISQLGNEILYGVNSLVDPVAYAKGDFILAWKLAGISPVLILFLMVAIPLTQVVHGTHYVATERG